VRQAGDVGQASIERRDLAGSAGFGEQVIAAQPFVGADEAAHLLRHLGHRGLLAGHHVGVEVGRPSYRLAGVVDDEIQARPRRHQLVAEGFDTRRVAQVEAEDLESIGPLVEVRLTRVAHRRVARKARRDDDMGAAAQQLEAGLVADLDAPAGQQRDPAAQVGQFGALGEVERRARRAQLIVEVVDDREPRLADVAVLRLDRLPRLGVRSSNDSGVELCSGVAFVGVDVAGLEAFRWEDVRRRHRRLAVQRADRGAGLELVVDLGARGLAGPRLVLRLATAGVAIRAVDVGDGAKQAVALLLGQLVEDPAIGGDRLEERRQLTQAVGGGHGWHRFRIRRDMVFPGRRRTAPPRHRRRG
jgi:hypothetical protein